MPRFTLLIEQERKPLTVASAASNLVKRIYDLFAQLPVESLPASISDSSSESLQIPLKRLNNLTSSSKNTYKRSEFEGNTV